VTEEFENFRPHRPPVKVADRSNGAQSLGWLDNKPVTPSSYRVAEKRGFVMLADLYERED
jgi:hypothetical protein